MPYWLFQHIFLNVDLDYFMEHGGIRCNLCEAEYLKYVYHIRGGHLWRMNWNIVGGPFVEVKAIELNLNYMADMIRYQIYQPVVTGMTPYQRRDRAWSLVTMWMDVVHSWKLAQHWNMTDEAWPDLMPPWQITDMANMPVVVRLKKQLARSAKALCPS